MSGFDVQTARRLLLIVAAAYLLIAGAIELSQFAGAVDSFSASELIRKLTALGSLAVGAVIGFYLASDQQQS